MSKKTSEKPSVSDRFHDIDAAALEQLGSRAVDGVMRDLQDLKLSLKQVAERNGVTMGDLAQIARYHKIDPVTLEETS